jgi:hypothetical protein
MEIGGVDRWMELTAWQWRFRARVLIIRDDEGNPMMVYDPQRRTSSPIDRKEWLPVIQDKSVMDTTT